MVSATRIDGQVDDQVSELGTNCTTLKDLTFQADPKNVRIELYASTKKKLLI